MKRNLKAGVSILAVVILGSLIGWWLWPRAASKVPAAQALYEKNCAVCHGLSGDGKGEVAYLLQPKPRNFRAGKFRLVTSQSLQPTREDVLRTITNGMAGTAMPSWAHLAENERLLLADYVLELNRAGWYDRGIALGYSKAEAEKYAAEMTEPGPPIAVPPEPAVTAEGLKQGRQLYLTACANCHGVNGEGKRDPTWRTAEGFPTWSRNLRQGVFKAGRDAKQLYITFSTGLPGTPMPSQTFSPAQTWRVVQYVQSLSDPAAQKEAEIRAKEVVAKRVPQLPSSPEDPAWEAVPEVRIPLMALWWRETSIEAVTVKAAHDGQRLVFRLAWKDPTRDTNGIRQTSFPDGAAIQLTADASPPLFAMGAQGQMVNIWHWKALWDEDRKDFQDVGTAFPAVVADAYYGSEKGWKSGPLDDPTFRPADKVRNLISSPHRTTRVEDANAAGVGTFTSQAANKQNVEGSSTWKDGIWSLQVGREFQARDRGDVPLRAGVRLSVAFAVWDGSSGDRNGQKSVSIWNTLTLE